MHICMYVYIRIYTAPTAAVDTTATHCKQYTVPAPTAAVDVAVAYCNTKHCNTLQHTATRCNSLHLRQQQRLMLLQHITTQGNTFQHTATHCNTLQHIATHCKILQHTATYCSILQHTTIDLVLHRLQLLQQTAPQQTATDCNRLQHIATQRVCVCVFVCMCACACV